MQIASPADAALVIDAGEPLGWIVAGELAARQPGVIAGHFPGGRSLAIDPRTWRFDPVLRWSLHGDGLLKPAYRDLRDRLFDGVTGEGDWWWPCARDAGRFIENVVAFQDRQLDDGRALDRQLFGFDLAGSLSPAFFFLPALALQDAASVARQMAVWEAASDYREHDGRSVDAVVVATPAVLKDDLVTRRIARALPPGRTWLVLPDFRQAAGGTRAGDLVRNLGYLCASIKAQGSLGLLGSGFRSASVGGQQLDAVAYAPYVVEGRLRKRAGGGSEHVYVTTVHGWEHRAAVSASILARQDISAFCAAAPCVDLFARLGPMGFVQTMLGSGDGSEVWRLRHQIGAHRAEIELVTRSARRDLVALLHREAATSPFSRPAADLERWASVLGTDISRAA